MTNINIIRIDEMGKYDIPAMIEFVLKTTRQPSLSFVAHGLGTTAFFIAMILQPELNSKVDVMVALSPITVLTNAKTTARRFAGITGTLLVFL